METKLSILGSGHLASHLAPGLKRVGYSIHQVYSRNMEAAKALAESCEALAVDKLANIDEGADAYLLMLSDTALVTLPSSFKKPGKLLIHTSGSISIDVLSKLSIYRAVLYPLQTFTKGQALDLNKVPFFIEATDAESEERVRELASHLSPQVYELNSKSRKLLHLAAIFACNFANNMYAISANLMQGVGLSFEFMHELILQTAEKTGHMNPLRAQTGPAARNDVKVMDEHLRLLQGSPEFAKIYLEISENIMRMGRSAQASHDTQESK